MDLDPDTIGGVGVVSGTLRNIWLVMAMALLPAATDITPTPIDEIADQKPILDAVDAAVAGEDYRALSATEAEFRKTRSRTVSGAWKLSIFYWRVLKELGAKSDGQQCDDRSADFFRGWTAATPASPAPYIAKAAVLEDYAWCIRGSGFAQSVSEEAFEGFRTKVEEARKVLATHPRAAIDPHYYSVMEQIEIDQGADKADFQKLLEEAVSREPDYQHLYYDAYRYFQPQWYGSDAEVDELARYAAAHTTRSEGMGMYARYYWNALDCHCTIDRSVDWPTMKQGMRDVWARYPSDWNAANFARISCLMKDGAEATSWFARVKKDYTAAWTDKDDMRKCESMAQFQTSVVHSFERCPYAAIEAWPNAEFERYCRRPQ